MNRYLVFGPAAAELQDGGVVLGHVEEQGTVLDRSIENKNLRNKERESDTWDQKLMSRK